MKIIYLIKKMNKRLESVRDLMKGKEKVHLKELYVLADGVKPHVLRSMLSVSISSGEGVFERLGGGFYRLKKQD